MNRTRTGAFARASCSFISNSMTSTISDFVALREPPGTRRMTSAARRMSFDLAEPSASRMAWSTAALSATVSSFGLRDFLGRARSVSRAVDTRRGLETRRPPMAGQSGGSKRFSTAGDGSEKLTSSCCAHPEANGTTPSSRSASSPVSASGQCARFATCLTVSRPRPPSSSSRRRRP